MLGFGEVDGKAAKHLGTHTFESSNQAVSVALGSGAAQAIRHGACGYIAFDVGVIGRHHTLGIAHHFRKTAGYGVAPRIWRRHDLRNHNARSRLKAAQDL